jgi:hypothetical protein
VDGETPNRSATAELVSRAQSYDARIITQDLDRYTKDEGWFRENLSFVFDPARIDREVRHIDRLARGVLVRETEVHWTARPDVPSGLHMSKDPAPVREWVRTRNRDGGRGRTVVKVTTRRIRRLP